MRDLASRSLAAALLLTPALPGWAQEEPIPESEHPATDSPEAVTAAHARAGLGRRRAQAFVIPLDEKARSAAGRVAAAVDRMLAGKKQYDLVDLAKALASDAEPEVAAKADEGRRLRADADRTFEAHAFIESVPKFRAALKALQGGAASLDAAELAETTLGLAASQLLAGDKKGAKDTFLAAALLDPLQKLSARSLDPAAEGPLKLARAEAESVPIGTLEVESRPPGARVLLDGVAHGTSPVRLELTGGKHLVRFERTGFYPSAELVEVTSRRDTVYSVTLQATPGASQVNQLIAGAADEAGRGRVGDLCVRLADRFHLDRVLVGSVGTHGPKAAVVLALIDPVRRAILGKDDLLLTADGTDADQVEADVQFAAAKLIAADDDLTAREGAVPASPPGGLPPIPILAPGQLPAPPPPAPVADPPLPNQGGAQTGSYGGMFGSPTSAAPGEPGRRAVIPGARSAAPRPSADEPALIRKERRVAIPPPPGPREAPAPPKAQAASSEREPAPAARPEETAAAPALERLRPGRKEKPAAEARPADLPKKADKGIKVKSGTEGWE